MPYEQTRIQEIDQARHQYVCKGNDLIRKSRYSLPVVQQKMLLYLISKIKPTDIGDEVFSFDIKDFCQVVGIDHTEGYYTRLKNELKELADTSAWITTQDGKERLFRWIEDPVIDPGVGTVEIQFKPIVRPYLFDLRDNYTQFMFVEVAKMKSKYAIRLYELLKSFAWGRDFQNEKVVDKTFTVDALKTLMDAGNYDRYFDFKKRALVPAVEEINSCSEQIHVEIIEQSRGRRVYSIAFIITKPNMVQAVLAKFETRKRLDGWGSDQ